MSTKKNLKNATLFAVNDEKDLDDVISLMPQRMKGESLLKIPVTLIDPDPDQPRKDYTDAELDDFHRRIMATGGITKPIDVYEHPNDPDRYMIEDGEMRWIVYSTRMDEEMIPSRLVTKKAEQGDILLRQLMANIGNIEMTLLDIARGIEEWRNSCEPAKTKKEAAEAFGWSQTKMTRTLKLLQAPEVIQSLSRETTNLNTLNHMIKLHKEDEALFATTLEVFQAESFDENPEKFWREAVKSAQEPDNTSPPQSEQPGLQEERRQQSVTAPSTEQTESQDHEGASERAGQAEKGASKAAEKRKAGACPLSEVKVSDGAGDLAVLQLFYQAGKETLQTEYTLTDEGVASLITQLQSYQANKAEQNG